MLIINGRVLIFRPSTALTKSDGEFFILFRHLTEDANGN